MGTRLFGLEDYDIIGYDLKRRRLPARGYREFRTWYDASGGYLPGRSRRLDSAL